MTQVSWTRQLGLAVALFLLGSFAYWMEFSRKPVQEAQQELSKKVFQLKDTPVQTLRLTDGKRTFELSCLDESKKLCKPGDNSSWELRQPMKSRADDTNANNLVSALNNLNSTETIGLKDETPEKRLALLREYGLDLPSRQDPNARRISVQTPAGLLTAYFGFAHPIGEGIFLLTELNGKVDDSRVFLIPNYFKSNLERDLTFWRDKKLLTLASQDVESFALEGKNAGKLQGILKEGGWTLQSQGEEYTGDIENIDGLLSGAAFLTAKSFISDRKEDAKARAALKGAKNVVTLTLQKRKGGETTALLPLTLKLFEKPSTAKGAVPLLYATVSGIDPLFELEATVKDRLDKNLKDLRLTKLITSMERFTAKKIVFSGKPLGNHPVSLLNNSGKWSLENDKSETDPQKIQALLEKLSGNRIKEFVSKIPSGAETGIEFVLSDEKNPSKRRLLFWKGEGKLYARDLNSRRSEAFLVDSAVQDGLPWEQGFFKPKSK